MRPAPAVTKRPSPRACSSADRRLPQRLRAASSMARGERLGEVVGGAQRRGLLLVLLPRAAGDDDDGQVLVVGQEAQLADQLEAVHARHLEVGEHQIEGLGAQLVHAVDAVDRQGDLDAQALEGHLGELAHRQRVVDEQHPQRAPRRRPPARAGRPRAAACRVLRGPGRRTRRGRRAWPGAACAPRWAFWMRPGDVEDQHQLARAADGDAGEQGMARPGRGRGS